jgi:parallel beta-helix repeat protein
MVNVPSLISLADDIAENAFVDITSSNESLLFSYSFDSPVFSTIQVSDDVFTSIRIANLSTSSLPGQPKLPVKTISILLPPHTEFSNITQISNPESIHLNHTLISNEDVRKNFYDDGLFNFNNWNKESNYTLVPERNVEVIGVGHARGYSILLLNLYPCRYNQSDNSLLFSNELTFSINTISKEQDYELFRNIPQDEEYITQFIENPSMTDSYSSMIGSYMKDSDNQSYEYIVITCDELEPYFTSLIKYKEQYLTARTVNFSFIHDNFYGADLQEKIRECITYAYVHWKTEYVLIGGDVSVVPYRGLWGEAFDHTGQLLQDDGIPSDFYYAGLDYSWDNDDDNIFGEDSSHSTMDEADLFAEVYVGRAPVENKVEIGTFINKVITFETSVKPNKILLHQSGINTNNEPDSSVIPERCADWIPPNYEIDKLYQVNDTISSSTWMSHFSDDNLIVEHTGNGEFDQYYVSWPAHIFTSYESASMLKNNFYPIHTSVSCNSGGFDYEDSIAETLLLNPYGGASACLFNSRRGFTSNTDAHKYSGELIEQQFYHIFYHPVDSIGKIQQYSKEVFAANALMDPAYRWCLYTLNLLGDPEMPVLETRSDYLSPNHFYVDDDFSRDTEGWNQTHFNSIQKGIDAASDWDVVHVNNGYYHEYVTIKKTIQLIGENKEHTIIDGKNGRGPLRITGNRIIIQGFTITNDALSSDSCRIHIKNSNYVTISDCIISDNQRGIYAVESTNLFIVNNNFDENKQSMYFPIKIGTVYVSHNQFSSNDEYSYGILGEANGEYIIHNNSFTSSTKFDEFSCALYLTGKMEVVSNTIYGFTIGVWFRNGKGTIEQNVIRKNDHIGIYASGSSVSISQNEIKENGNNWITYHHDFEPGGIVLDGSSTQSCYIDSNSVLDNRGYGVLLKGYFSLDNEVVHNDFIDNSINAFYRNSYCSWNNNFWDKERVFPKIIFGVYETDSFLKMLFLSIDFFPKSFRLN